MSESDDQISEAIRALRKDLSMTQVEFAGILGVAPASVHRWEAGTSAPDFEMIISLWSLAVEHGSAISIHFAEFLSGRANAMRPLFKAAQAPSIQALDDEIASLSPDQNQLAHAFIHMLKHNTDATTEQIVRFLLEPWKRRYLQGKRSQQESTHIKVARSKSAKKNPK
jgi:transcriptional regulator with XRE-family HTH domain